MRAQSDIGLPEGYGLIREIDLQKDKKLAFWLNMAAGAAMLAMLAPVLPMLGSALWGGVPLLPLLALLLGMFVCPIAHEWVHGIFIRLFCGQKANYGFTGLYAFAGKKDAYFCKTHYLIIALAPVVIWGAVLAILCALAQGPWFLVAYFIQIMNLTGAAGDFYVVCLCLRAPAGLLVNDDGVSMRFYLKKEDC